MFVAPAWKSSFEDTAAMAERKIPSGNVIWGLDGMQEVFEAYGIGGQPAGAIVTADGSLISTWRGAKNPDQIREILDTLLADA